MLSKTGSMALDCSGQGWEGRGALYSQVILNWINVAIFYIVQGTDGVNSVRKVNPVKFQWFQKSNSG